MALSQDQIRTALAEVEPGRSLRTLLEAQVAAGVPREQLIDDLDLCADHLGAEGRSREEDLVLDAMDALAGFCHPSARI